MTENEAIELLKNNYPKTRKMVDGRLQGGFDDHECDVGIVIDLAIKALEEIQQYRAIGTVKEFQTKVVDKWISVTDRLPDDGDCRFYMCLVENHIEDVPMMCQFEEEVGFGFYKDIYDPVSLGFIDTELKPMKK